MIPNIKFATLFTTQDWADALKEILSQARQETDPDERISLQDLLLVYIKKSPPTVELLDVIAREAIDDLALSEISASLARIASRDAELLRTTGMISAVTREAKMDARALQLESTFEALAKAQAAVDAFTKLEKALKKPDQKLLAKLKAAAEAITSVNELVQPDSASLE